MSEDLQPGYRRALTHPPVLVLDAKERAGRLKQAVADPEQVWVLQEFDGRAFTTHATVRGPDARACYLQHPPRDVPHPRQHTLPKA